MRRGAYKQEGGGPTICLSDTQLGTNFVKILTLLTYLMPSLISPSIKTPRDTLLGVYRRG